MKKFITYLKLKYFCKHEWFEWDNFHDSGTMTTVHRCFKCDKNKYTIIKYK